MSLPQSSSYPQGSSYHHSNDQFPPVDTRYFQYLAPSPTTSQPQATYHRAQPFSAPTGLENQPHVDYAVDATSVNGQELYPGHVYPEDAVQPSGVPAQWSYQDGQEYANYQSVQPGERWMTEQQPQPFDHSYGAAQVFQAPSESSAQAALPNQHQGFYTEPEDISPSSDHSGVRYSPSDYFTDQRTGFEDGRYSSGSSGSGSSRGSSDYHGHGSQSASHFARSGQTACAEPRRSRHHDLQPPVFYEHTKSHPFGHIHHHAYQHQRAPSPMAHLPYPEEMQRQMTGSSFAHSPTDNDPRWSEYRPEARTYVHQPQPHYPTPTPHSNEAQYNQRYTPGSIALPAPTRSPPLIEDTPKKPLSLACLFCRKRKIACGSPPPDRADRTCNQCARRSLKCEYPVASRRGMRPRNDGDGGDGLIQFSPMNQ